jgi:N-methylhydantoinase A/oxoprolinase/acetone carboxylase beta subunit
MVGKLLPAFFPSVFGPNADQPLDADVVREKFAALAEQIGDGKSAEDVAEGFIRIAVENMANAIKKISVQRGSPQGNRCKPFKRLRKGTGGPGHSGKRRRHQSSYAAAL